MEDMSQVNKAPSHALNKLYMALTTAPHTFTNVKVLNKVKKAVNNGVRGLSDALKKILNEVLN